MPHPQLPACFGFTIIVINIESYFFFFLIPKIKVHEEYSYLKLLSTRVPVANEEASLRAPHGNSPPLLLPSANGCKKKYRSH